MVDNADEVVIELAHTIDGSLAGMAKEAGLQVPGRGEAPPVPLQEAMAYQLRELVNSHIQDQHLSSAYASASETVRAGSG